MYYLEQRNKQLELADEMVNQIYWYDGVVNKLADENKSLKQALNEIREYIYKNSIPINLLSNPPKETLDFEGDITDILKIINKYMKEDDTN